MGTEEELVLRDLHNRLKNRFEDELSDIVLFGSRLKGESNADSDYDLLIILKHKPNWELEREISDICYDIDLKYNVITDTLVISEPELQNLRGKQPVYVNALENGLRL
jgi:predicted nucleotidyltransferase